MLFAGQESRIKDGIMLLRFLFLAVLLGQQRDFPLEVNSLFDFRQPLTLGLRPVEGAETIAIFHPGENDSKYNHGVMVFPFKGILYAQWQTSAADEDAGDAHVMYGRSTDGKKWSAPRCGTRRSSSGQAGR